MLTQVYEWEEVTGEVSEYTVDVPTGLTTRQTLVLANDELATQTVTNPSRIVSVTEADGVIVGDATFGSREKKCRLYVCLDDPARAKALAEKDANGDETVQD